MVEINWRALDKQLNTLQRHLYVHLGKPHSDEWEDAIPVQMVILHIHAEIQREGERHGIHRR